jgi:predicted TIM-barrel fold metal-dependent hydrolase
MKLKTLFALIFLVGLIIFQANAQQQYYTGKIIDMHEHIALNDAEQHSMSAEHNNTLKDILANISVNHLSKAAIITIAQKGQMDQTRLRNDSVIHLSRLYPSLIPICSVHPADGAEALAEMERVQKLGVKIIKLHPNYQQFDVASPEVTAVAQKAGELHMILLFDSYNPADVNEDGKLIMLAVTHPDARFIFAHMGLVNFPQFLTLVGLSKYPWYKKNVWFDLSAIAPILGDSPFRDQLVWTIRKIGISQFLFGSDYPLFDPATSIKSVYKMNFTRAEEAQIFYNNACDLLQLQR